MKAYVLDKASKYTEIAVSHQVIDQIDDIIADIFLSNDRNKDQLLARSEFHMPTSAKAREDNRNWRKDEL